MKHKALALTIAAAAAVAVFFAIDLGSIRTQSLNRFNQSSTAIISTNASSTSPIESEQPPASPPQTAKQFPPSRAPWAGLQRKYEEGDFRWLVQNARLYPQQGSYSYAIKVLAECSEIAWHGGEEYQIAQIEASHGPNKDLRTAAVRRLFKPCQGLGSAAEMKAQRAALSKEIRAAGDKKEELLGVAVLRLPDKRIPVEEREQIFRQLLELDDPEMAAALKGAIIREGALLNGKPLSGEERGALAAAWDMAVCRTYGRCMGFDSRAATLECAFRGDCAFRDTYQAVQEFAPVSSSENMARYHSIVLNALQNHSYGAFGLPRRRYSISGPAWRATR